MKIDDLRYELGAENIASEPAEIRLGSRDLGRMLVVQRDKGTLINSSVWDLPTWLNPGDVLVLNNSKRIPGVLQARTEEGGQVEIRIAELKEHTALCRIYPSHRVDVGVKLTVGNNLQLDVLGSRIGPHKLFEVRSSSSDDLREILKAVGLPITSFFSRGYWNLENYNTVYASKEGAVESPMAGVHFTERLLNRISDHGVATVFLTLHAVGSWLPFIEKEIDDHVAEVEPFNIPGDTAEVVNAAKRDGKRVIAVGSTVFRALETASTNGTVQACSGRSALFIKPGFKPNVVDAYFTNFHPSQSSLMVLDAAFCPHELLMRAYRTARERGYFFHEFGDAIFFQ